MIKPESKHPVTIEDLLRVKRAERAAPEFWAHFEAELRAKQLAAIVDKKPWWNRMPRLVTTLRRYPLPLGAAAIFTITFVSVQHFHSSRPHNTTPAAIPVEEMIAAVDSPQSVPMLKTETSSVVREETVAATEPSVGIASTGTSADATEPGRLLEMVLRVGGTQQDDANASPMPAVQRLVATDLEAVKAAHPELARKFLGHAASFETGSERKPAIDPFTRLRGPAEIKRDRLLAKALPVTLNTTWSGGERIAHRLSQERVAEDPEVSRIGASGDRLSLKF